MNNSAIFWPVIIQALATLYLYIPMSARRIASVKSGEAKASDYRLVEKEPADVRQMTRAIANQYEAPILFYAVCISAYVTQNAGTVMLVLAWAFVIVKCCHVFVQSTSNRLRIRRPIFMVSFFVLIAMWVVFALQLGGLV
jgi:hypothetical protein